MKHRRKTIKAYEDEPDQPLQSIGSYNSFTEVPKDDKPVIKRQIGFIRTQKKCSRPKKKS
jgi:hypothetical protein